MEHSTISKPLSLFLKQTLVVVILVTLVTSSTSSRQRGSGGNLEGTSGQEQMVPNRIITPDHPGLTFVPNAGQSTLGAQFIALGFGASALFFINEVALALPLGNPRPEEIQAKPENPPVDPASFAVLREQFFSTNPSLQITGIHPSTGRVNFFIGDNPDQWQTGLPAYGGVQYHQIYPGIDLLYLSEQGSLKSTFQIAPGVDARQIHWRYPDAQKVQLDKVNGDLIISLAPTGQKAGPSSAGPQVIEKAPNAWQVIDGKQVPVPVRYLLLPDHSLAFNPGTYNTEYPLTIDPAIEYSSYWGGSDSDTLAGIAIGPDGDIYLSGFTNSTEFPVISGTVSSRHNPNIFVTRLNPDLHTPVYLSVFGGSELENSPSIAVDQQGNAYITGETSSNDFPLVNPLQPAYAGGGADGFITKLDPSGSQLLFSSYLGGSGYDSLHGIALIEPGIAALVGETSSSDFPLSEGPFDRDLNGSWDAAIVKIDTQKPSLVYSTYLGGSGNDGGSEIHIGQDGSIYLTGSTASSDFPIKAALQPTFKVGECWFGTCSDAFIARLAQDGKALIFSTYLGGSNDDRASNVALDAKGNIYVIGSTSSEDFPVLYPAQTFRGGNWEGDIFLSKLTPSGSQLVFSTYLGGIDDEGASDIAIDSRGNIYITGSTTSACLPPFSIRKNSGTQDAFLGILTSTGRPAYLAYLAGKGFDMGIALALDQQDKIIVAGVTGSPDFLLVKPVKNTLSGNEDGFLARFGAFQPARDKLENPIYLALVMSQPATGIYGRATYNGCAAENVPLELRFFNGKGWSSAGTTVTDQEGHYSFTNLPSLDPGQYYYVLYKNADDTPGRLWSWATPLIDNYTSPGGINMGDFDIGEIGLLQPEYGATVPLPTTFTWVRRKSTPDDSYELNLVDPQDEKNWWWTEPPLGYTGHYVLSQLPNGFKAGKPYFWMVGAYSPNGGYGLSYSTHLIYFTGSLQRQEPNQFQNQAPPEFMDIRRTDPQLAR